jgi:ubiquinone/menaquinone biosynthesis C-methylase UbiE
MAANPDARFYDRAADLDPRDIQRVVGTIASYYRRYAGELDARFAGRTDVRTVELGAGTCSLSLLVASKPYVGEASCVDISLERMRVLAPIAAQQLGGDVGKLTFVQGDLVEPLDIPDRSVDLVLFDASLHHSRSMWRTLEECRRILRDDGLVIAQREQYLGTLTAGLKLRQLAQTEEVLGGVSENAYLREQYEYDFRACGFTPRFIAAPETFLQRLMGPLNGWVMSKWIAIAEKGQPGTASPPGRA